LTEIDEDGAAATARALTNDDHAVWVGSPEDPELQEFEAELEHRRQ
jgi:hypothetical protein